MARPEGTCASSKAILVKCSSQFRLGRETIPPLFEGRHLGEAQVVSFFAPEAFHALAPGDPQSVIPSSLLMKRIHQCRLADASLTGDENYPALTVQRSLQRVMQFGQSGIPAHHLLCRP